MIPVENNLVRWHGPLSAAKFNRIKTIDEQRCDVKPETLQLIAELFVRHRHDNEFGIYLVHRHGLLREGHGMVHSCPSEGVDICQVLPITGDLHPYAFLLDEDDHGEYRFLPYEFSSTPHMDPSLEFVSALTKLLRKYELQGILGLCRAAPSEPPWTEYVAGDGESTISLQVNGSEDLFGQNGIITQWGFSSEGGTVSVKALRECVKPEGGGHKKK